MSTKGGGKKKGGIRRPSTSSSSLQSPSSSTSIGKSRATFSALEQHGTLGYLPTSGTTTQTKQEHEVDPQAMVLLTKLKKRDSTTRIKALKDLVALLDTLSDDALTGVIVHWPRLYARLSPDAHRRVRELTQKVWAVLVKRGGKAIQPVMKDIMGPWLVSTYDTTAIVANTAKDAFQAVFSPEKQVKSLVFCQKEIIRFLSRNTCEVSLESLKEAGLGEDDIELREKLLRIQTGSLLALRHMLSTLPLKDLMRCDEEYRSLLTTPRLWKLAKTDHVALHRAVSDLAVVTLRHHRQWVDGIEERIVKSCVSTLLLTNPSHSNSNKKKSGKGKSNQSKHKSISDTQSADATLSSSQPSYAPPTNAGVATSALAGVVSLAKIDPELLWGVLPFADLSAYLTHILQHGGLGPQYATTFTALPHILGSAPADTPIAARVSLVRALSEGVRLMGSMDARRVNSWANCFVASTHTLATSTQNDPSVLASISDICTTMLCNLLLNQDFKSVRRLFPTVFNVVHALHTISEDIVSKVLKSVRESILAAFQNEPQEGNDLQSVQATPTSTKAKVGSDKDSFAVVLLDSLNQLWGQAQHKPQSARASNMGSRTASHNFPSTPTTPSAPPLTNAVEYTAEIGECLDFLREFAAQVVVVLVRQHNTRQLASEADSKDSHHQQQQEEQGEQQEGEQQEEQEDKQTSGGKRLDDTIHSLATLVCLFKFTHEEVSDVTRTDASSSGSEARELHRFFTLALQQYCGSGTTTPPPTETGAEDMVQWSRGVQDALVLSNDELCLVLEACLHLTTASTCADIAHIFMCLVSDNTTCVAALTALQIVHLPVDVYGVLVPQKVKDVVDGKVNFLIAMRDWQKLDTILKCILSPIRCSGGSTSDTGVERWSLQLLLTSHQIASFITHLADACPSPYDDSESSWQKMHGDVSETGKTPASLSSPSAAISTKRIDSESQQQVVPSLLSVIVTVLSSVVSLADTIDSSMFATAEVNESAAFLAAKVVMNHHTPAGTLTQLHSVLQLHRVHDSPSHSQQITSNNNSNKSNDDDDDGGNDENGTHSAMAGICGFHDALRDACMHLALAWPLGCGSREVYDTVVSDLVNMGCFLHSDALLKHRATVLSYLTVPHPPTTREEVCAAYSLLLNGCAIPQAVGKAHASRLHSLCHTPNKAYSNILPQPATTSTHQPPVSLGVGAKSHIGKAAGKQQGVVTVAASGDGYEVSRPSSLLFNTRMLMLKIGGDCNDDLIDILDNADNDDDDDYYAYSNNNGDGNAQSNVVMNNADDDDESYDGESDIDTDDDVSDISSVDNDHNSNNNNNDDGDLKPKNHSSRNSNHHHHKRKHTAHLKKLAKDTIPGRPATKQARYPLQPTHTVFEEAGRLSHNAAQFGIALLACKHTLSFWQQHPAFAADILSRVCLCVAECSIATSCSDGSNNYNMSSWLGAGELDQLWADICALSCNLSLSSLCFQTLVRDGASDAYYSVCSAVAIRKLVPHILANRSDTASGDSAVGVKNVLDDVCSRLNGKRGHHHDSFSVCDSNCSALVQALVAVNASCAESVATLTNTATITGITGSNKSRDDDEDDGDEDEGDDEDDVDLYGDVGTVFVPLSNAVSAVCSRLDSIATNANNSLSKDKLSKMGLVGRKAYERQQQFSRLFGFATEKEWALTSNVLDTFNRCEGDKIGIIDTHIILLRFTKLS